MARHMVHVSETLVVAVQSLQGLKQQQAEFSVQHLQATKLTSTNSQSNFHLQLQLLQSLLARADSNKARLQNEINLAFNAEAQRDSKVQARIGEEARKKTASMKAIAVVTMIFLPSTFVATFFSMSFFHFDPPITSGSGNLSVSHAFWMYWAVSIPLSLLTFLVWRLWEERNRNRHRAYTQTVV
ncbi:hypothetical protein XANCAGTX0491_007784 [Xanthoria calcicola]